MTDVIYIYNGATLTIESALSCLKIYAGQTSAGAAGANNRYGLIVVDAGVTVTFAGNATATNSGIQMNPTSADASSKGCTLTINGTAASPVTFTNDGAALDTNKKYYVNLTYGIVRISFLNVDYAWGGTMFTIATAAAFTNAAPVATDVVCSAIGVSTSTTGIIAIGATVNLACDFRRWTINPGAATFNLAFLYNTGTTIASGGSFNISGLNCPGNSSGYLIPLLVKATPVTGQVRIAFADIRPTTIIPTGLAFTDPALDGELRFTITNIASYANSDEICIHNNADNALLACIDVSRYNTLGYGIVPGLTNGVTYTLKARATSDNNTYSDYSATATGTPTSSTKNIRNTSPRKIQMIPKATAYTIEWQILSVSTGLPVDASALNAVTCQLAKDGGAFAPITNAISKKAASTGIYQVTLTAAETNCGRIYALPACSDAGTYIAPIEIETDGGKLAGVADASTPPSYSVSGNVSDNDSANMAGVNVELKNSSGETQYKGITDASGNYSIPCLSGSYSIVAVRAGYTFTAESAVVGAGNITGKDLVGTKFVVTSPDPQLVAVYGTVRNPNSAGAVENLVVIATPKSSGWVDGVLYTKMKTYDTTNASGQFELFVLPNQLYTITFKNEGAVMKEVFVTPTVDSDISDIV